MGCGVTCCLRIDVHTLLRYAAVQFHPTILRVIVLSALTTTVVFLIPALIPTLLLGLVINPLFTTPLSQPPCLEGFTFSFISDFGWALLSLNFSISSFRSLILFLVDATSFWDLVSPSFLSRVPIASLYFTRVSSTALRISTISLCWFMVKDQLEVVVIVWKI
jgi:hypothetical protein